VIAVRPSNRTKQDFILNFLDDDTSTAWVLYGTKETGWLFGLHFDPEDGSEIVPN
jgi:hypothetical protein